MTADKDALKMLSYELDAVVYDAEHGRFDQTCINTLKMVSSGIAALTAQQPQSEAQEPVACSCGEINTLGVVHRKDAPCFYWQEGAPPSGVREGMLRAAEICSRLDLDFQDGKCDPSPSDCAEAITRAAEQVDAEGQPADGVVVPEEVLKSIRGWLVLILDPNINVSKQQYRPQIESDISRIDALLAAAKEPR